MGNSNSAASRRKPQNRLSKPKTNSSSNLLSLKTPSNNSQFLNGVTANGPYRAGEDEAAPAALARPPKSQRDGSTSRKRLSLFRLKSSQRDSYHPHVDTGPEMDLVEVVEVPQVNRYSRASSITAEFAGGQSYHGGSVGDTWPSVLNHRRSMQQDYAPYAQYQQQAVLHDQAQPPQSEFIGTSATYLDYEQDVTSPRFSHPPPRRINSDTNLYAPMRRSSLLQHGIATRRSYVEIPSHEAPPAIYLGDDLENSYYRTEPSSSMLPPLSNPAALGQNLQEDTPRAKTPGDLDYGHIGAYKLGSLRITNGAASPVASIGGRPETRGSEPDAALASAGDRESLDILNRHTPNKRTYSFTEGPEPLSLSDGESIFQKSKSKSDEFTPLTIDTLLPLPDFSSTTFSFEKCESPTKSLELAREYMQDLVMSPFSFDDSPPMSPQLEPTSKNTAVEDNLFETEYELPSSDTLDLGPRSFDSGYQAEEYFAAFEQSKVAAKNRADLEPKPLAKADSGYSSNMSLRSFKSKSAPAVPPKELPPTPPPQSRSRDASSTYSTDSPPNAFDLQIRTKESLTALPVEMELPRVPSRDAPLVPQKHPARESQKVSPSPHPPPKSREQTKIASLSKSSGTPSKTSRRQTMPASVAAAGENKPIDMASQIKGSGLSGPKEKIIKKQRPQSLQPVQPLFTVQAVRESDEASKIPPISAEVSEKLEKRVDGFPIAIFPNTLARTAGLRNTVSKETLGTIFSVGSLELKEGPSFARLQSALPPLPSQKAILKDEGSSVPKPELNKRFTFQSGDPNSPVRAKRLRARQSLQSVLPEQRFDLQKKEEQQTHERLNLQVRSSPKISSSLEKSRFNSPIDATTPVTPSFAESQARSFTSQIEMDADSASPGLYNSTKPAMSTLHNRRSWDSITAGNIRSDSISTSTSRSSNRRYPPQAHANRGGILPEPSARDVLVERRSAFSTFNGDLRSNPPISPTFVQAHQRINPSSRGSRTGLQPSRTPPITPVRQQFALAPATINRPTPAQTAHSLSIMQQRESATAHLLVELPDSSAAQHNLQRMRRQSADEPVHQEVRMRRSMEMRRPDSAQPISNYQRLPQPALHGRLSFDYGERRVFGNSYNWGNRYQSQNETPYTATQYDTTYGSFDQENRRNSSNQYVEDSAYYEPDSYVESIQNDAHYMSQSSYSRKDSLSEMLDLDRDRDRYAGALNYSHKPRYRAGSGGPVHIGYMAAVDRGSVGVAMPYRR